MDQSGRPDRRAGMKREDWSMTAILGSRQAYTTENPLCHSDEQPELAAWPHDHFVDVRRSAVSGAVGRRGPSELAGRDTAGCTAGSYLSDRRTSTRPVTCALFLRRGAESSLRKAPRCAPPPRYHWRIRYRLSARMIAGVRTAGPHAEGPDMRIGGPHSGNACGRRRAAPPTGNPSALSHDRGPTSRGLRGSLVTVVAFHWDQQRPHP